MNIDPQSALNESLSFMAKIFKQFSTPDIVAQTCYLEQAFHNFLLLFQVSFLTLQQNPRAALQSILKGAPSGYSVNIKAEYLIYNEAYV